MFYYPAHTQKQTRDTQQKGRKKIFKKKKKMRLTHFQKQKINFENDIPVFFLVSIASFSAE